MRLKLFLSAAVISTFLIPKVAICQVLTFRDKPAPIFKSDSKLLKENPARLKLAEPDHNKYPGFIERNALANASFGKAKLMGKTKNFDIYQLPLDNMPCAVPDKSYTDGMKTIRKSFVQDFGLGGK